MAAQYWGKKDAASIEEVMPIALRTNLIFSGAFTVFAAVAPEVLMRIFTSDPALIESGAVYLRAVSLSYLLCGISQIYLILLKNTGYATVSSRISCTAVVVNIICNAILIYGLLGLPALGIQGAAYATVAARLVELVWSYLETKQSGRVQIIWKKMFHAADAVLTKDFWRYTTPVLGAALVWGIAYVSYSVIMGHMGSDAVTLDLDGVIVPEELPEFERQVNEVIEKNVEIEILYPSREELEKIDYRSKKEIAGQVRIVRIGSYDTCACCGTHVEYTGEIRLVKLLGIQNYKGGVRISMLAGRDAIEDYEKKHAMIQEATHLLSVKPDQVDSGIRKLLDANAALKSKLIAFQRQIGEEKAAAVPEGTRKICFLEPNFQSDELREMCNKAAVKAELVLGLLPIREGLCQYVLISNQADVRELGKALNEEFNGKGGGQPSMVQGTLMADGEEIKAYFLE